MKTTNLIAALALAFAVTAAHAADEVKAAAPAAQAYNYKTPKLNRQQLDALLAKPSQLLVIDLRRPDELTKIGGLPVYLSIQSKDVEKSLDYIPKDRNIITVSNHAGRAGAAGDLLSSKGYKVVGAVGVQNYEEEGGTLTKIAPPAPKTADASAAIVN
jgi:rhodanese-related sulfurtransferase